MRLYMAPEADKSLAKQYSEQLQIELVALEESLQERVPKQELYLYLEEDGLFLCQGALAMRGDLTNMLPRLRQGALQAEALVRAVRFRNGPEKPVVLDATAGMGEDSLLLAAAGCEVWLYEKDPVIATLLQDALYRAQKDSLLGQIVERMHFAAEDSIAAMQEHRHEVDVVYLDPMFPERVKSGMIKKKFQLLQQLERPCDNEQALLQAAMEADPMKIVIKRPQKGPHLAGAVPSYTIPGKSIRYDCLVLRT